jgi:hypothetical protein
MKGMSTVDVIIALVLGLIVVILLVAAFTGKLALSEKIQSCGGIGGTCQSREQTCDAAKPITTFTSDCKGDMQKCCIPLGG